MPRALGPSARIRVLLLGLLFPGVAVLADHAAAAPRQDRPGARVGRFELGAPDADEFILRGTLPLPPGTYPRADGLSPFVMVDPDGNETQCQVEIVSRYPDDADGADVVELLARTSAGRGAARGERIQVDVRHAPGETGSFVPHPDVAELLAEAGALRIRTHDAFGHEYAADLYADARTQSDSVRVLRDGRYARQVATHETLFPVLEVPGFAGTLPHMMGVHAYVTEWSGEPFVSLDLRIHNAHSGANPGGPVDDPLGRIYFRGLELRLPAGWTLLHALDSPSVGQPYVQGDRTVYPLVAPLDDGTLHVLPQLAQFPRRLAICRVGYEERALAVLREETLGFCRDGISLDTGELLWSWWNPRTARYFPQRHRLPSLAHVGLDELRAERDTEFLARADQLAGRAPPEWPIVAAQPLGWAFPWGTDTGGAVSGHEIHLWDGVVTAASASTGGYRLFQLTHRLTTERQANVLFNENGVHTRVEDWLVEFEGVDYLPVWWFDEPLLWAADPFGFEMASTTQTDTADTLGLAPWYEEELLAYTPIFRTHLVRYTRSPKVLVWLGNDALARDDLRSQAEGVRFSYSMYRQDVWSMISTGMRAAREYVDEYPGWGFAFGRGEAWALDTMSAAYSTLDPEWRQSTRGWFDDVLDLVRDGQSTCLGNIMSSPLGNIFNAQYRCRQSIECAITENALVSLRESVYGAADPGRAAEVDSVLERSLYGMLDPLIWDDALHGPWAMVAVGDYDTTLPPYCTSWPSDGNYGIVDQFQIWSSFAYGYEVTGDPVFLERAAEMAESDLATYLHEEGTHFIEQRVALLALLQATEPINAFCNGDDGTHALCPCGNIGAPERGCNVAHGSGGVVLDVIAQQTSPDNRATLRGTGYPAMGIPTTVLMRAASLAETPTAFGDGVRCVGTPIVRIGAAFGIDTVSEHTLGHGSIAGAGSFFYQVWFRNTPATYCMPEAFNVSSGRRLTW